MHTVVVLFDIRESLDKGRDEEGKDGTEWVLTVGPASVIAMLKIKCEHAAKPVLDVDQ